MTAVWTLNRGFKSIPGVVVRRLRKRRKQASPRSFSWRLRSRATHLVIKDSDEVGDLDTLRSQAGYLRAV